MSQRRALYDIPSLPETIQKQKYIQTPNIYDDPNTIQNFMMETLRYTGTDAPLHEQDMPRKSSNPLSQAILSSREHGSRYTHAPFHPEIFLGDMTKDQRMSVNEPLVAQITDQNRFRQSRYIEGKLQDVADVRTEGMVGTKTMLRKVKDGMSNTATRMGGIFGDSSDTIVSRTNPNPGNTIHKVGDVLKEDQKFYQTEGEKILPSYGTDIVGKLSNMVGVQWSVQPEAKVGLSSVSNVYRSKQEVDQSANAVFRIGKQDTKFKDTTIGFKNGESVRQVDSLKSARSTIQNAVVSSNKDSMKNKFAMKMLPPPVPTTLADRFIGTQSQKRQIETKAAAYKFHINKGRQESLMEPIKETTMTTTNRLSTIPSKDRIAIVYKTKNTHKLAFRNEDKSTRQNYSGKMLSKAFRVRPETNLEKMKTKDLATVQYANGIPVKGIDHVSNTKMTQSKFSALKEQTVAPSTGSNIIPAVLSINDFEFDTDPTIDNQYQTRRGVKQRSDNRSTHQEQDNIVSPLADTVNPFRTNYIKNTNM